MTDLQLTTKEGSAVGLSETTARAFAEHMRGDLLRPDRLRSGADRKERHRGSPA